MGKKKIRLHIGCEMFIKKGILTLMPIIYLM